MCVRSCVCMCMHPIAKSDWIFAVFTFAFIHPQNNTILLPASNQELHLEYFCLFFCCHCRCRRRLLLRVFHIKMTSYYDYWTNSFVSPYNLKWVPQTTKYLQINAGLNIKHINCNVMYLYSFTFVGHFLSVVTRWCGLQWQKQKRHTNNKCDEIRY